MMFALVLVMLVMAFSWGSLRAQGRVSRRKESIMTAWLVVALTILFLHLERL